jgi:hypothetical protein
VNSEPGPLDALRPSARRWKLGPVQGDGLQSGGGVGLDRLESP